MELDEDMFLVIVGDEGTPDTEPYQEVTIKQEKDDITPSLVTDEKDPYQKQSDFTELLNTIKEEPEDYEVEFLDENYDFYVDAPETADETYDPKKGLQQYSKKYSKKGNKRTHTNPHLTVSSDDNTASTQDIKVNTHQKPKSYVEELLKLNPELADDQEALVEALVEVMRQVRPPPLPQDYFIMNDINFECVECGHLSETIPAASRHYSEKHGPRYLICLACGDDFRSTTNLYKHERRCRARYARLVAAARKRQGHPRTAAHKPPPQKELKTYPCTMCSAVFRSPGDLNAHINCHLGRRPYTCSVCSKAYSSRSALYKHLKKHSDLQFICDQCQRVFKIKSAFVAHMDTHKPERKFNTYPCTMCSAVFRSPGGLKAHINCHLGRRPYMCSVCSMAYSSAPALSKHMKKHSDRQFICDHCQRAFQLKSAIVAHMDTHKPERKFPCSECAQRFAQRAALELHVRRAHKGLPLPCACALCPTRYPRMTLLKKHMLRKHGLHLMTKMMFYKQLPTLTETQLQEATVVANADLDNIYLDSELQTLEPDD